MNSSANSADYELFKWVILIQNRTILMNRCVSLFLLLNLLYFAKLTGIKMFENGAKAIQPLMRAFLFFHTILLLASMPADLQKNFTFFDPNTQLDLIFWLYAIAGPYPFLQPFLTVFITFERILILRFPLRFTTCYRRKYLRTMVVLTVFFYALLVACYAIELPLDKQKVLACDPLICIGLKYKFVPQYVVKGIFGAANLLSAVLFFRWLNQDFGKKIKYRVVKFTIICEILFDLFPVFANLLITNWTGKTLNRFVGSFVNVMATFDVTLCAIFYNLIFLTQRQNM